MTIAVDMGGKATKTNKQTTINACIDLDWSYFIIRGSKRIKFQKYLASEYDLTVKSL